MIAGLEILNLHAQGGMAEVFRARGQGADGNHWTYAVKRILPSLVQDAHLRSMFAEEARIASMLLHKNIVRVYDLAKSDSDEYFIVMEFLEGKDLAEAIDRANDYGACLPIWFAIHCAREVLAALHFANAEALDRSGQRLGLVHRDISPHNIFLTFDGQVKLTDFGVAKVQASQLHTQVGVTKGKFGYMSPEQLMGEALDVRSDLYNVGILLFEMLTGRRLFWAETPAQFLHAMAQGRVPALPSSLAVPPALEALMRQALQADRTQRPMTAEAFDQALASIQSQFGLWAQPSHVRDHLRVLFREEQAAAVAAPVPVVEVARPLTSVIVAVPEAVQRQARTVAPVAAVAHAEDAFMLATTYDGAEVEQARQRAQKAAAVELAPRKKSTVGRGTGLNAVALGVEETGPIPQHDARSAAAPERPPTVSVITRSARVVPLAPGK